MLTRWTHIWHDIMSLSNYDKCHVHVSAKIDLKVHIVYDIYVFVLNALTGFIIKPFKETCLKNWSSPKHVWF